MTRTPWSAERKAYVQRQLANGSSFAQIAGRLGLTWQAVAQSATIYNLRPVCQRAGWTPERLAKLKEYHAAGMSASESARALGETTRNAVIGKWARLGLKRENLDKRSRTPRKVHVPKAPKVAKAPPKPVNDKPHRPTAPTLDYVAAMKPGPFARPWEERGPNQCAWPFGERGAVLSCCAPIGEGERYCKEHHQIGHTSEPPSKPRVVEGYYANIERFKADKDWSNPIRSWEAA